MSGAWRALRRRILTPNVAETRLATRGFHVKSPDARNLLETVGASFVAGFGHAVGAASPAEAEHRLASVDRDFRGFAYEGAGMGFGIMDGLGLGGGHCVDRFLAGGARRHVYMTIIGAGWALARLPRWRWHRVLPADPVLSWLALDGYGFHQAYFRTKRYVSERYQDHAFAWRGHRGGYALRVIDQGIGRALWFVAGSDVDRVTALINDFAQDRHADLYSGAGLAATYAGGVSRDELELLRSQAGAHQPAVAQASAFAAKARVLAGLVTPHTAVATGVFCASTPDEAARLTDVKLADLPPDTEVPAFEVWRRRIAATYATVGHP